MHPTTADTGPPRRRTGARAAVTALALAATAAAGLALPTTARAADDDGPTVYIASDSTAQTYDTGYAPQTGWGQVLDQFFSEDVTIANHAIGGRSSRSFVEEGRLDAILDEIEPGDYLFVQFGHNDGTVSRPERYTPPADYKEYLRDDYITGALERGATPVILTPVARRLFNPATGALDDAFPEYERAAREVAAEEDVPLIDLAATSRAYFEEVGPIEARSSFLHVPPGVYAGRPAGTLDETHFQEYGATQVARLIAEDVARLDVPLSDEVENTGPPRHRPDRPSGISATDIGHDGARLTWEAADGADLYRVEARNRDERHGRYTLVATSPIPLADVTGLDSGARYDLRVVAVNGRGESAPSRAVTLTTPDADLRFDFGTEGSPVADGWTGVSPATAYTAEAGYGFTDGAAALTAADRGAGTDDVTRDFVSYPGGRYGFAADVPDGTYTVSVSVGDPDGYSRTGFVLDGSDRGQVIGYTGEPTRQTFTQVTVADGQLNVTFYGETGHINGLELSRVR
ncbi:GDSL-type esterase/lipase family protein [Streptomyces sp. RFCAC02]|uniref:GDSL-type esterase/lipase family protein n=1 Tax=Streptomyces sp. RFCAC02 TaxID=2499143 RepID=UPI00143CCBB8|nr:GDSL-type esterase/lipase family protein [Streptomyces sp. RFCAC02]